MTSSFYAVAVDGEAMNGTVMDFVRRSLPASEVRYRRILEVGSLDINGSPKEIIGPLGPREYIGCDLVKGKGVDLILDASKLVETFGRESFDIVVSTEMLEHAEDWRAAVIQMKRVLRPGGPIVLTTRSPGYHYHPFPKDCWRFTKDDMKGIFSDMKISLLEDDSAETGVFVTAWKTNSGIETNLKRIEVYQMPEYKAQSVLG